VISMTRAQRYRRLAEDIREILVEFKEEISENENLQEDLDQAYCEALFTATEEEDEENSDVVDCCGDLVNPCFDGV